MRVVDKNGTWRIIYRIDVDAIVVVGVFSKKTRGDAETGAQRRQAQAARL